MSTVLTNGIIIPENGSRNWGGDLANNWNIIDVNIGYMNDVKNRVTTLENSVAENSSNIEINASNISALQTSKQDKIEDLETIRAGASAGATAVQPSALNNYVDLSSEQTISGTKTFNSVVLGERLGTSSKKWKTLNDINPGALSLPNCGEYVNVISQVVKTDDTFQYTNNLHDGWLVVTALADNVAIAVNQLFERRAVRSADNVVTVDVALRLNDTAYMRFANFTKFAYVQLYKCVGNA